MIGRQRGWERGTEREGQREREKVNHWREMYVDYEGIRQMYREEERNKEGGRNKEDCASAKRVMKITVDKQRGREKKIKWKRNCKKSEDRHEHSM